VHVHSAKGKRRIDFADFHRLPGDTPQLDSVLEAGELITHIELPPGERFAAHSAYVKVRDRSSYAFALVSCGAALEFGKNGAIKAARIALGSVAAKPWRLREAEQVLEGEQPSAALFAAAADMLLGGAMGHGANDFKIPLARRTVVRALDYATAGTNDNAYAADEQADTREAP
jgi:xanthine dehydrogenase YagS FAD-binding subunit